MNIELQKQLFDKYPKIFRQKDLPMSQTCMCWGCECGDGWYSLLDKLCGDIQTYLDSHPEVEQVEAEQVKQKFGGLRFYTCGGDDVTDKLVNEAESESYKVCEKCGSRESITQTKGWVVTICQKCLQTH